MNTSRDVVVGIFVLLGLLCTAYLTVKLGRMESFGSKGLELTARFTSVSGLRVGAGIEMAGVQVGRVSSITLDTKTAQAVVVLGFSVPIELSEDTIASVKTSGLIGDKYINLAPGGSETMLTSGDTIEETESAVDLESLLSKYAFGGV